MPSQKPSSSKEEEKRMHAGECLDILTDISVLLNSNLNRNQIAICVSLIENGVNPEALATAIQELRHGAQEAQKNASPA